MDYTLLGLLMDTACTSTQQAMERDIPCMFTVLAVKKGYTLHMHTACDINRYTLTSTIPVGERKTPPHPHC
jgi:hypothetical protein